MRSSKMTVLGAFATALILLPTLPPTAVDAQPARPNPVQRNDDAEPVRRGFTDGRWARGPADAASIDRGPVDSIPGAGLLADVVPFWDRPAAVERLSLTEEQVTRLRENFEKTRPTIEASRTKMREANQVLTEALSHEGATDAEALRKAVNDFTAAQNAALLAAVEHRVAVQSTLNAEQLGDLHQMRQRMRAAARGPEGGPPPPPRADAPPPPPDAREQAIRERMANRDEQVRQARERQREIQERQPPRGERTPEEREQAIRERMADRDEQVRQARERQNTN